MIQLRPSIQVVCVDGEVTGEIPDILMVALRNLVTNRDHAHGPADQRRVRHPPPGLFTGIGLQLQNDKRFFYPLRHFSRKFVTTGDPLRGIAAGQPSAFFAVRRRSDGGSGSTAPFVPAPFVCDDPVAQRHLATCVRCNADVLEEPGRTLPQTQ